MVKWRVCCEKHTKSYVVIWLLNDWNKLYFLRNLNLNIEKQSKFKTGKNCKNQISQILIEELKGSMLNQIFELEKQQYKC